MAETRIYDEETAPGPIDTATLRDELARSLEATGSTRCTSVTFDGRDPAGSRISAEFTAALTAQEITNTTAVIAAHPASAPVIGDELAVSSGVDYQLGELYVAEGESVALRAAAHVALGTAAAFTDAWLEWRLVARRPVGGSVTVSLAGTAVIASIPGLQIEPIAGTDKVDLVLNLRRGGSMTVFSKSITIESRGKVAS